VFDVVKIMRDPGACLFERVDLAAKATNLRPAGDAGHDAMAMEVSLDCVAIKPIAGLHRNRMRARTDQGHVAAQHIDQLRQLIDAQSAKDATDAGNPRVILHRALRPGLVAPLTYIVRNLRTWITALLKPKRL
jgi:hypothetical protein